MSNTSNKMFTEYSVLSPHKRTRYRKISFIIPNTWATRTKNFKHRNSHVLKQQRKRLGTRTLLEKKTKKISSITQQYRHTKHERLRNSKLL